MDRINITDTVKWRSWKAPKGGRVLVTAPAVTTEYKVRDGQRIELLPDWMHWRLTIGKFKGTTMIDDHYQVVFISSEDD